MFCKNCGNQLDDKAIICPKCGVPQAPLTTLQNPPPATPKKPVNGLGIAGFVIGLLSFYFGSFFCITPLVGLILSAVGMGLSKKYSINGLAIAGLVINIIVLIFWAFMFILAILLPGTYPPEVIY